MTDEEKMELEALRAEKHSREQTERAKAALSAAGVSAGFAALLVGADDADTDKQSLRLRERGFRAGRTRWSVRAAA